MNNYKLLPALMALLETRNLTDAARRLNVTQPAMSKALRLIREEFQDPILIRDGQQFTLTQRGEQLKERLPALLFQLDQLYLPPQANIQHCERSFRLAFNSFVSMDILPALCSELYEKAPQAGIQTSLWQNASLSELRETDVDLLGTLAVTVPENLYGKKLASDHYVICCCEENDIAIKGVSLEHYFAARHILVSGLHEESRQVDNLFRQHKKQRRVFATLPSLRLALETVIGTECLVTVPLHIAAQYAKHYPLAVLSAPFELATHNYYLLWHAKFQNDDEHRWFRELCFTHLQRDFQAKLALGSALISSSN
ncbi:LysR family transcriptional regulator [Vibrio fluvialis]|nr:LysR family transcriptional regulator [Vibrio fluvialis]